MAQELEKTTWAKQEFPELTPKQQAIVDALKLGNTRQASFGYVGVPKSTFYHWLETDCTFLDAVTRAEANAEVSFVTTLAKAAGMGGDWRAAESWLKRRRRDEWGDNIASRADKEVESLLASLFPTETNGDDSPDTTVQAGENTAGSNPDTEGDIQL